MAKEKKAVVTPGEDTEEVITSTSEILVPVIAERPTFIDLIKFTAKDASLKTIKEKRAEYDKVKIDGVADTVNYKAVVANMSQMRDDRRAFENAAYDNVIDPIKEALKEYAADIESVVEEFKAGEKAERDKKDFIDNEKKRIKQEAEEAKARAVLQRSSDLTGLGGIFNGSTYSFPFDDGLSINTLQLKEYDDEEFADFVQEVKDAYQVEQKRLADEELEKEAEAERQREQAEQVAQQQLANQEAEKVLAEKTKALRMKELRLMGAVLQDDGTYKVTDKPTLHLAPLSVLLEYSDEQWDQLIIDIDSHVEVPVELVEEEPNDIENDWAGIGEDANLNEPVEIESEIASGNPVSEPNESYVSNESIADDEDGLLEVTMRFTESEPYTDMQINDKIFIRVYPKELQELAMAGIDTIGTSGQLQSLEWVLLKKITE